jgi:hypothetical protein
MSTPSVDFDNYYEMIHHDREDIMANLSDINIAKHINMVFNYGYSAFN